MLPLEAGPFALTDRLTPIPPPARPSWNGVVADGLSNAPGVRGAVEASAITLVGADGSAFAGASDSTLGDTGASVASETVGVESSPAGALHEQGQKVSGRAGQVAPYLPNPSADVQMNFIDPPQAPKPGDPGNPGFAPPPPRGAPKGT